VLTLKIQRMGNQLKITIINTDVEKFPRHVDSKKKEKDFCLYISVYLLHELYFEI